MGQSPGDRALRLLAVIVALLAVVIVTLSPSIPVNRASDAHPGDSTQRQSAAATTKGYAFLLRSPDHRYPARWCPGSVGYAIDTSEVAAAGMDPAEEVARWRLVFDEWSRQTGGQYTFTYEGPRQLQTKDDGQLDIDSIDTGTIGITYVHGDGQPGSAYQAGAVQGRTAGNGGLQVVSMGPQEASAMVGDKGFVMIDVDDASRLAADGLRRTLYQHESGHSLGLGHVGAQDSIMNGTLSSDRLTVGPGDRAGLLELTGMPCEHP